MGHFVRFVHVLTDSKKASGFFLPQDRLANLPSKKSGARKKRQKKPNPQLGEQKMCSHAEVKEEKERKRERERENKLQGKLENLRSFRTDADRGWARRKMISGFPTT